MVLRGWRILLLNLLSVLLEIVNICLSFFQRSRANLTQMQVQFLGLLKDITVKDKLNGVLLVDLGQMQQLRPDHMLSYKLIFSLNIFINEMRNLLIQRHLMMFIVWLESLDHQRVTAEKLPRHIPFGISKLNFISVDQQMVVKLRFW